MSAVVNNAAGSRFELELDDGAIAIADYRIEGDRIVFSHTVVPEAHEGQGIGSRLVVAGLDFARDKGLNVVPQCSFFAHYMAKHSETRDLLAPGADEMPGV